MNNILQKPQKLCIFIQIDIYCSDAAKAYVTFEKVANNVLFGKRTKP